MGDLLEDGAAWLSAHRKAHLAHNVTYKRGAHSVELAATVGRSVFEQTDEYSVVRQLVLRDFLIQAADLILNEVTVLPQLGDRVHEEINGLVYVYEVLSPGTEPPYRFCDQRYATLRVHTKHVATEAP